MMLKETSIELDDLLTGVSLLFASTRILIGCLIGDTSGLVMPSENEGLNTGLFFFTESGLEVIWKYFVKVHKY